jgi:L-asparaginase
MPPIRFAAHLLRAALLAALIFAGCTAPEPRPAVTVRVTRQHNTTPPPPTATALPTVAIITTGGTIAMRVDPATGDAVPALSGAELIAAVPQLRDLANLRVTPLCNIDSRNMSPERWRALAQLVNRTLADRTVTGVVVTHGTDTMEDSVHFVDRTLTSTKPVVFTGAMRSASAADADGPRNLLNAVRQVLDPDAGGRGATINFNGLILPARRATKVHTNHVDAFTAHGNGPIGDVDDERVNWYARPARAPALSLPSALPRVEMVYCYPGADGGLIDAAVAAGAAGIVVCGYGIGNVNEPVFAAIERARQRGVAIVLTTRVQNGRVYPAYGGDGGGTSMRAMGVVFGGDRLPWKARVLLMIALAESRDPAALQAIFDQP